MGFAAHGHPQGKQGGQKMSTGQDEILSEKNTPAGRIEGVSININRMKILALERPVTGVKDSQLTENLLCEEAAKAWELYQSGVLRELYFHKDRHEAVLVLECGSESDARRQLAELPLVRAGMIHFEVIPLIPYPGFSRLFERNKS